MTSPLNTGNNIASMMQALRAQQAQAKSALPQVNLVEAGKPPAISFADAVKTAVSKVNELQTQSKVLQERYERGDTELPLSEVVVGMQKSSLAFEATLQVRNKVLKAYEEIMNMPV
jgi:flagellar hook-basal body complex protein FliE